MNWAQQRQRSRYVLAVHGGAGRIRRTMHPEREQGYRKGLKKALTAGREVLQAGGASLDAVEAAVSVLESIPLFNAGRGSVLTGKGTVEMDAAVMEGATRRAGAVAGVRQVRHPVALARRVMEASPHVMLVGEGADDFARQHELEVEPGSYFQTERRRRQLERRQRRERGEEAEPTGDVDEPLDKKFGTVGAVALDQAGNLAAATSTGGTTNKLPGRVGDSPLIGAGTYADNDTCAVSGTGHGEYFIRGVVAHDIAALMRYGDLSLGEAARTVVLEKLPRLGGNGGVIAVDRHGHSVMPFTTSGMLRGQVREGEAPLVKLFEDE